ncbi:nose resistant to fluoxetine protein 6 [Pieris rapae]|uniref:nose resistant to fluoxetine protein 6 n=1 Tax=Pieris rapae TaxID=64459 RepID=UPI001E27AE3B|nr:nose resistant to fluoxetine protein 6 [Pieris rapae]
MVRLRWTLALILIGVSILATVSAFRVRLAHERFDSQNHCASCDVNELDLDQKQSKLSNRHVYEGLKKVVHEKLKSDGKLSADDLSYLHGLSDDKKLSPNVQVKTKKPDVNDGEHIDKHQKNSKTIHSDGLKVIKSTFTSDNNIHQDENDNIIVTATKVKAQILNEALDATDDEIDIVDENDSDSDGDIDTNENDDEKNIETDESDEDDDEIVIQITKVPPKVINDPTPPTKRPLSKSEQSADVKDRIRENIKDQSKIEKSKDILEIKLSDKRSIVGIKNELPKKTTKEGEIKENIVKKIKDQISKKEKDTFSKESTSDELEKIKVKSHLEAGKLQSHIISKEESVLDIKKVDKVDEKRPDEALRVTKDGKVKNRIKDDKIKPLTDATHIKKLIQSDFDDFYGFFPTFAPNFSRVHNPECRRHGQILLRQLRGTKLWALNMLDSSAKIPSGLLQGNGIQLGDFDQCLSTRARVQLETGSIVKVQGKYCLVTMDVRAEHQDLEVAIDLLQGRNLIKGRVSDPGHFVPRFSTLSWGVCVPSPCQPDDVEAMIKDSTKRYEKLGISFNIQVDAVDCHIQSKSNWWDEWMELPTLLTLCFYGVVLCVVIIATCQDLLSEKSNGDDTDKNKEDNVDGETNQQDGFVSAFSLTRTVKKLIAPVGAKEISSIHGLRAIATIALIIAHKFLPIAHAPYSNRVKVAEVVSSPAWSWCRVGWVFTDGFLLLSGALTAYRTSEKTSAFKKLGSKYLRLTPAMLAVIWFYAFIWDHVTVGPMWGLVTKNADICRESWWWNLFYLQNYFGLESMCAPQTHQLALDMQLSILGSFIVWAIHSNMVGSALIMPIIHLSAAYSRYTMFRDHRLTMIAYHGVSVSQLYRTGRMSYTSILHRSTSYLIGISLGLALRTPAQHSKFVIFIGWVVSTGLWVAVLWAGFDSGYFNYQYNVTFAAQYAALAPIAIGLAFAWLLYAAHNGYSETLSSLLCSRPMLLISRLSYALYLTQFIVFLTNAATTRTSTEFTLLSVVDLQEIAAIFLSAVLLTLTLVIPMQSLPNVLFGIKKNNNQKEELQNGTSEINKEENEPELEEKPSIRKPLLAHRELLEEIPEVEVEYETQRETQSLEEILEEDDNMDEDREDEDLEIIEEEEEEPEGGEENFWAHHDDGRDRDLDEWEWTNGNRGGAQHYRYSR